MRLRKLTLAALLASSVLAGGCKPAGSKKLTGHWKGQKAEGVPDTIQVSANDFAERTEIRAQGNQIAIRTPTSDSTATYTIDKEDATSLEIHTNRDNTRETFTFGDNGASMVWKMDKQRSLTFKKLDK